MHNKEIVQKYGERCAFLLEQIKISDQKKENSNIAEIEIEYLKGIMQDFKNFVKDNNFSISYLASFKIISRETLSGWIKRNVLPKPCSIDKINEIMEKAFEHKNRKQCL